MGGEVEGIAQIQRHRCGPDAGTYLFELVYDENQHKAWLYWHSSDNATQGPKPIDCAELVKRAEVKFLPGVNPIKQTSKGSKRGLNSRGPKQATLTFLQANALCINPQFQPEMWSSW